METPPAIRLDTLGVYEDHRPERSVLRSALRFFRDPKAAVGGAILALVLFLAMAGPIVAPYGENEQDHTESLSQPSAQHWFGTDRLGRDVFSRVIFGARISVAIGLIAVAVGMSVGVPLGLLAGFAGGWIDDAIMRVVDAWVAFPNLILLLAIINILGPGTTNVMIAVGLNSFPIYARLIRGQTLSVREQDFITACRSTGASQSRIAVRHVLPNVVQPVIVQGSLAVGFAVLSEAGLSFLGVGVKPPTATWGVIIQDGFAVIRVNPWVSIAPGVAITAFVLAVNLVGDRLRDVLDPRLRGVI